MAGQINELAAEHTRETLAGLALGRSDWTAVVVGRRLYGLFEDEAANIEKLYNVPGSAAGLTPLVQDLLVDIESWRQQPGLNHIFIFYNHHGTGAGYEPRSFRLLPLDRRWLEELRKEPWPTRNLPAHSMDREHLFSALVREYLFVALYRSLAQSLASENASRLAAMQGAEKNIQEQLDRLTGLYHQRRQMAITEELLDIVSGFEALKQERR
jgi:F-type H+-transporting ATPase subunit gamma